MGVDVTPELLGILVLCVTAILSSFLAGQAMKRSEFERFLLWAILCVLSCIAMAYLALKDLF